MRWETDSKCCFVKNIIIAPRSCSHFYHNCFSSLNYVQDDRKSLPNSRTPADGRQQFRLEDILGLITLLLGVPFGMIFVASELVASTVFRMASLGIHWMSYKRKSRVMPGDGHVLITGASSGIGMDVAKQLALRGYNLVLVARRKELLEELANELRMHKRAGTEVFLDVQVSLLQAPPQVEPRYYSFDVAIVLLLNIVSCLTIIQACVSR